MEFYVLIELRKEHSVVGLSDIYVEINKEFEDYSRKEKMETYKTKKMLLKKKKKKISLGNFISGYLDILNKHKNIASDLFSKIILKETIKLDQESLVKLTDSVSLWPAALRGGGKGGHTREVSG